MTNLESDDDRLSRAMRRLMQVQPPELAPSPQRAYRWFGAIVAGLVTLVLVAGAIGGTIALRGRSTFATGPAGPSHATNSPAANGRPTFSPVLILTPASLPSWMSACLQSDGITAVAPANGPRLTRAQVIAFVAAAGASVGPDPTTAYLQFLTPSVDPTAKSFAQPAWAVGVDGLHFGTYGGHGPGELATPSPQLYISGMIEFVSDPGGSVFLELGCPSG